MKTVMCEHELPGSKKKKSTLEEIISEENQYEAKNKYGSSFMYVSAVFVALR